MELTISPLPSANEPPFHALAVTTRAATTIVAAIRFMTSTYIRERASLMVLIMRGAGGDATEEFLTSLSGAAKHRADTLRRMRVRAKTV